MFSLFCFFPLLFIGFNAGTVLLFVLGLVSLPLPIIKAFWEIILPYNKSCLRFGFFMILFVSGILLTPASVNEASETQTIDSTVTVVTVTESTEELLETNEFYLDRVEINLEKIIEYSDESYLILNDNYPFFDTENVPFISQEYYGDLDELGRSTYAYAILGSDLIPEEENPGVGQLRPTGWHTIRYDELINDRYLYNRCHLIAYQLTGESSNINNLITGTRYLNIEGMSQFENMIAEYIHETENHVVYRVTPVYDGDNLVASGVLMEAYSVEDQGQGICFNVYCYNVQPGIDIDYKTGESEIAEGYMALLPGVLPIIGNTTDEDIVSNMEEPSFEPAPSVTAEPGSVYQITYVLNKNTHKFHYQSCSSVQQIKDKNKAYHTGTRDEIIAMNYKPCGRCNP